MAFSNLNLWSKKFKKAQDIPDSELPDHYDLRNINGIDFSGKVRDQGR